MTLSIGDGANDVNMIQTANVGIGISGQEGVQAVNASDYAISQFRFLKNLLLVHGRNNYRNLSYTILYSFYKNIALIFTLFFFNFDNGQSGTTLYESIIKVGWNVFLACPIIALGCFDKDVTDEVALLNPIIYKPGQVNMFLNRSKFLKWTVNAIIHGSIIYWIPFGLLSGSSWDSEGKIDGFLADGTTMYLAILSVAQFKVAIMMYTWSLIPVVVWIASYLFGWFFIVVYSAIWPSNSFYYVMIVACSRPTFWLLNILLPLACIGIDVATQYTYSMYFPTPVTILRENKHLPAQGQGQGQGHGGGNGSSGAIGGSGSAGSINGNGVNNKGPQAPAAGEDRKRRIWS
jgi:phospholipid-transporting ATPase